MKTFESRRTWLKNLKMLGGVSVVLTSFLNGVEAKADAATLPILTVEEGRAVQQEWTKNEFKSFFGDTAATVQNGMLRAFTGYTAPVCQAHTGSTSYNLTMIIVGLDLAASLKLPVGQSVRLSPAFRLTFTRAKTLSQ